MSLKKTIKFIINHPLNKDQKINALLRFVKWQTISRLNPKPKVFSYGEKSKFLISKGLAGATGNLYCGLHEFEDMAFVLHFLRDTDSFIDIGANVGSYTLLGANEVGASTVSIEPIPSTFKILKDNLILNGIQDSVKALNIGLGSKKGELHFTKSLDTVNHVATRDEKNTINVPIEKFDDIIKLNRPSLIKIDVEGFETEVLNGMTEALSNKNLYAIIIELNGSGLRYGYNENHIHTKLTSKGFLPYLYSPFERQLVAINKRGTSNTIYIRDINFVKQRIETSKKFKINRKEI